MSNIKYLYKGKLTELQKFGFEKWRNRSDVYEKVVDDYEINVFKDRSISFSNDILDIYDWPMQSNFEYLIQDLIESDHVKVKIYKRGK